MGMIANSMIDERESSLLTTDEIYDLIEKTMVGKRPKVRIRAITTLGNSGDPRALRSLIDSCKDQNPEIRRSAIVGLQNMRSSRSVDVLIDRIRDKGELPENRQRAAAALATIRSYSAIQELRNRYGDTDENGSLRTFIGGELNRVQIW
jgi:HEAT repeat protein